MNMTETTEEIGIPQVKKVLYTASVHTTGGRDGGSSTSSDGQLEVKTSLPGAPGGTNPEQLFAAAWSTCFTSAMKAAAGKMKAKFPPDHATDTEVDLCLDEQDSYFIRARLNVSLPGVDHETAQSIVDAAHQLCPYSKATRGNIDVQINLV